MDIPTLLTHLQHHDTALTLPRGSAPRWDDADLHRAAHTDDAEGYALLGLAPGVRPWQRARVLLQILAASQAGLGDRARAVQARTARVLTLGLPPGHVITVLLTLRRLRANHKHTTRTALRFVLEHPGADALIAARRPALLDCFEHALGTDTARGCARRIHGGDTGSDYLRRRLLRFLTDPAAAPARVQALYGTTREPAHLPVPDEPALALDTLRERPATITATNRGDIAATLVHLYRGGPSEDLYAALGRQVDQAARAFPRFTGTLALVLDASASMRGYGDRAWAVLSQAAALRMVLSQVCDRLEVIETGGDERAPAAPPTWPPASWTPSAPTPTWSPSSPTDTRTSSPATWPASWPACRAPASPPRWCSATPCSPAATTSPCGAPPPPSRSAGSGTRTTSTNSCPGCSGTATPARPGCAPPCTPAWTPWSGGPTPWPPASPPEHPARTSRAPRGPHRPHRPRRAAPTEGSTA
ncbi:hypothetical protein LUW74_11920 [Actinomadura madurae]|uniref:hypothetical protein n=1 Tax=Actinomadura madurae TaxID=1993 RepID=UPI002026779A|nr:hypothetical protein [Actinomadura madurae]URN03962.1 hypothetical protein LUW74_11920 [Actinomadura madurae]